MKAISIRQPWAGLIASGKKTIEVRSWYTHFRGDLLICASARPVMDGLPAGVAVAIVDVKNCRPMESRDIPAACVGDMFTGNDMGFIPGYFAWEMGNVREIGTAEQFPVSGKRMFYNIDFEKELKQWMK